MSGVRCAPPTGVLCASATSSWSARLVVIVVAVVVVDASGFILVAVCESCTQQKRHIGSLQCQAAAASWNVKRRHSPPRWTIASVECFIFQGLIQVLKCQETRDKTKNWHWFGYFYRQTKFEVENNCSKVSCNQLNNTLRCAQKLTRELANLVCRT